MGERFHYEKTIRFPLDKNQFSTWIGTWIQAKTQCYSSIPILVIVSFSILEHIHFLVDVSIREVNGETGAVLGFFNGIF